MGMNLFIVEDFKLLFLKAAVSFLLVIRIQDMRSCEVKRGIIFLKQACAITRSCVEGYIIVC